MILITFLLSIFIVFIIYLLIYLLEDSLCVVFRKGTKVTSVKRFINDVFDLFIYSFYIGYDVFYFLFVILFIYDELFMIYLLIDYLFMVNLRLSMIIIFLVRFFFSSCYLATLQCYQSLCSHSNIYNDVMQNKT